MTQVVYLLACISCIALVLHHNLARYPLEYLLSSQVYTDFDTRNSSHESTEIRLSRSLRKRRGKRKRSSTGVKQSSVEFDPSGISSNVDVNITSSNYFTTYLRDIAVSLQGFHLLESDNNTVYSATTRGGSMLVAEIILPTNVGGGIHKKKSGLTEYRKSDIGNGLIAGMIIVERRNAGKLQNMVTSSYLSKSHNMGSDRLKYEILKTLEKEEQSSASSHFLGLDVIPTSKHIISGETRQWKRIISQKQAKGVERSPKDTLIIITTCNHIDVSILAAQYLRYSLKNADLVFIDDNSVDGTSQYLIKKGFFVITKSKPMGLTDSWNRGFQLGIAMGYSYVIFANNDLLIPEGAVDAIRRELENEALVVPLTTIEGAGHNPMQVISL